MVAAEVPVLREHGLEMWEYVALGGLEHGPAPTQSQLATAIGRDPTRLIPTLESLETRGLVLRRPDPDDRRNRVVSLTAPGRSLLADCRASIRTMEDKLLTDLDQEQRTAFRATLEMLAK